MLYFLISSTSTRIIWRRHLEEGLRPFVMAETISWGILSHGTSNMSGHVISCGGALLAPLGSGCGDELEHEDKLVIEDEVDENEEFG